VKSCWDLSPERRPEFGVLRRDIDKFYRGASGMRDDYYSPDELTSEEMYLNAN